MLSKLFSTFTCCAVLLGLVGCGMQSAGSYEPARIVQSEQTIASLELSRQKNEIEYLTRAAFRERDPVHLVETSPATKPADPRLVIYSAAYKLVVADVAGTLRSLQATAEKMGGYMQEIGGGTITFRIPAAKFGEACKSVEDAGEVVDRQVRAQDVTEEMRDLNIRLDNAEKLRERLLELLKKADKVEDTIKIEAELTRVVEQIEQTKGKIRYLSSQLAMSTIRVELNSPVPQNARGTGPKLPFSWVEELGDGLVAGQVQQQTRKLGYFASGPRFTPPVGFVRYYEQSNEVEAMNAEGLRLRVLRRNNVDKAPLSFWQSLARKSLVEGRSLVVTGQEGDDNYFYLTGTRDLGGNTLGYVLGIKRSDNQVAVFEAWGPKDQIEKAAAELRKSALSVDAR